MAAQNRRALLAGRTALAAARRPARHQTFQRDYPEAAPLLLYRGSETLERDGVRCMPVDRFLRELVPGRDLPR